MNDSALNVARIQFKHRLDGISRENVRAGIMRLLRDDPKLDDDSVFIKAVSDELRRLSLLSAETTSR